MSLFNPSKKFISHTLNKHGIYIPRIRTRNKILVNDSLPSRQVVRMDQQPEDHSGFQCWTTPKCRHVHDDPFMKRKLPYPIRVTGSVLFNILPSVIFIGCLATAVVVVDKYSEVSINLSPTLTTVLGFVVGLSIAFRNQTAYERYTEGRRLWNQLQLVVRNMGRVIWLQIPHGKDTAARDVLAKRSAINLLLAYSVALKHHLREERGTYYDDLYPLVKHLPRHYAHYSSDGRPPSSKDRNGRSTSPFSMFSDRTRINSHGQYEDIPSSLFKGDRRDLACQGTLIQGNLPLEIANYLTNFAEHVQADGRLSIPLYNAMMTGTGQLVEVLTNCERILRTPIPLAYNIAISQTVWVFVLLLPFQLCQLFQWVTIPASMISAYILFGLLHISYEIENPFGYDINDLDLDRYCRGLSVDLDLITSYMPSPDPKEWLYTVENRPLWPLQHPVSFSETDKMGLDTVKERLDERRKRVMELWGKGSEKAEQERAKKVELKYRGNGKTASVSEREVSPGSGDTIV